MSDLKSAICNLETKIWTLESGMWDLNSEAWNLRSDIRNQQTPSDDSYAHKCFPRLPTAFALSVDLASTQFSTCQILECVLIATQDHQAGC